MCLSNEIQLKSIKRQQGFILYLINCAFAIVFKCIKVFLQYLCCRPKDVNGQIVLITGAARGLGRQLALRFSHLGCPVVLWDVNLTSCQETAKMIRDCGGQAFVYECDLNDRHLIYETARKVCKDVGKVDILVNNAGVVNGTFLTDTPDEKIIETFNVNVLAHFWTVKAFVDDMMADNYGHIVTISSGGGIVGLSHLTDYCASKFASIGFIDSLKREMEVRGYDGIRFTVVCPGMMNTTNSTKFPVIPVLKVERAAEDILKAVLKDRDMVIIPTIMATLIFMKHFVPDSVWSKIYHIVGAGKTMKEFVPGHKKG